MRTGLEAKNGTASQTVELCLLSAAALYVELLVIRWFGSDIRMFTVFRTFPLVACFVGMGAGFGLGRDMSFRWTLFALAETILAVILAEVSKISDVSFPSSSVYQFANLQIQYADGAHTALLILWLFLLLSGPFAVCMCLGSRLGVLFNKLEPLEAYCTNIGGSILGSILFTVLSCSGIPPLALLVGISPVICLFLLKRFGMSWTPLVVLAVVVSLALLMPQSTGATFPAALSRFQAATQT